MTADDREALREACRQLRRGGLLMVTVPAYQPSFRSNGSFCAG